MKYRIRYDYDILNKGYYGEYYDEQVCLWYRQTNHYFTKWGVKRQIKKYRTSQKEPLTVEEFELN